MINIDSIITI